MTNAKKNPAGAGQVSAESKVHHASNGKVIPFRAKAGECRKQKQKGERRKKKKTAGITWKFQRKYVQTEIPFPIQDGNDGTSSELAFDLI